MVTLNLGRTGNLPHIGDIKSGDAMGQMGQKYGQVVADEWRDPWWK
jgi:hypothetical protein